ncbi:MAG TPA: zf-HC2 domain-containing protein [Gemmatimonadales bacterium]|nr:zf-HC2 domain-containing protein [Gemmatimonadales bacterium]
MADSTHEQWLLQIDAELDGELSLVERAALAKHLATCAHCAGARASQLEVRVALARSAGNPHAFVVPRPTIRAGTLALWVMIALGIGGIAGWAAHQHWGGPGGGSTLEESRGTIVVH